jgi:N utilization substance protein A
MAVGLAEAIRSLVEDRGISEELVRKTIEDFLLAAYKRKFNTTENAVVRFNEDGSEVSIFAAKEIVEEVFDPVTEIELSEALTFSEECEIGDELLIEINPQEFDRVAVQSAKQKAKQTLREIQKDTLYSEFKEKEGEMVIGYFQRERNGNIFVDLGKIEGILPRRYQSPREVYRPNDRIKALIYEVSKSPTGLQIILSRTHTDFVKRIFELEVPEVYDRTVEIFKIVREPGYRTKIAVFSNRDDVDPVGACVGMKGVRIQAVVRELEGEKIDILKYDIDPRSFIKNALSPAEVQNVVVLDESKRQALAVVDENQLSLAIGKQGLNVRLANRLVDWNIDVKTNDQFEEMDISTEKKKELNALFNDNEYDENIEEISKIAELPGISERLAEILMQNGIELIETLISLSAEDLSRLEGVTAQDVEKILSIISESVDIIEQEEEEEEEEGTIEEDEGEQEASDAGEKEVVHEETYECPECGHPITIDMTSCPNCGVGLSFEVEEDDEESEDEEEQEV